MHFKKLFHFILAGIFALSSMAIAEEYPANFHIVIAPHLSADQAPFSSDYRLEFRDQPFDKMDDVIRECQNEGILPRYDQKPPVLYIYLPNEQIFNEQGAALARIARTNFQKFYPKIELIIKFRILSNDATVSFVHATVKNLVQEIKQNPNATDEEEHFADQLEKENEKAFHQAVKTFEITAPMARKVKYSVATARFLVVGATRAMQTLPALAFGGPAAFAALALIVGDATTEFINVAFTQKIQRALAKFPFRFQPNSRIGRSAGFLNRLILNMALFSVGRPTVMQTLGHASNPDIPNPTVESVSNVFGVSLVGAFLYSFFTNGYETLRDKGWVSSSKIDVVLQISGLFDLATGIINSNPHWYFLRVFTLGPQWLFYIVIGLLAKFLPTKSDEMVAVHTSIVNWRDIHEEQRTHRSWHIETPEDFRKAMAAIKGQADTPCAGQLKPELVED